RQQSAHWNDIGTIVVMIPSSHAVGRCVEDRISGGEMYCRLVRVKAIAEAVAREMRDGVEIRGVTSGEARRAYTEILVTSRAPDAAPRVLVIGVDRRLTEPALRAEIIQKLRAALESEACFRATG